MNKKYYIDSCIWRDYLEEREDKFRPLGEWAFRIIQKIIKDEDVIVISDAIFEELRGFNPNIDIKITELVPELCLSYMESSKKQFIEAKNIAKTLKIPINDALHAILARDNQAILITRDKHFLDLLNIVDVKKPEDLI